MFAFGIVVALFSSWINLIVYWSYMDTALPGKDPMDFLIIGSQYAYEDSGFWFYWGMVRLYE